MSEEFDTNERPVKVEMHFHVVLAAAPQSDRAAFANGDPNASRFYGEPPRKSRWIAKSFGVLAFIVVAVVGVRFAQLMTPSPERRAELGAYPAPRLRQPLPAAPDMDGVERPVARADAPIVQEPHIVGEAPRRGTAAFGLH